LFRSWLFYFLHRKRFLLPDPLHYFCPLGRVPSLQVGRALLSTPLVSLGNAKLGNSPIESPLSGFEMNVIFDSFSLDHFWAEDFPTFPSRRRAAVEPPRGIPPFFIAATLSLLPRCFSSPPSSSTLKPLRRPLLA